MDKYIENQVISFNNLFKEYDSLYQGFDKVIEMPRAVAGVLFTLEEYRIANKKICTQRDVVDAMLYSKQSINSAIKQLKDGGYITLEAIRGNKKSKNICLTAKGEQLVKDKITPIAEAEYRAFSKLTDEDRKDMLYLLSKINSLLEDEFAQIME